MVIITILAMRKLKFKEVIAFVPMIPSSLLKATSDLKTEKQY